MQFWTIEEQFPIPERTRLRAKQSHKNPPFIEKTSFWSRVLGFVGSLVNDACESLSFEKHGQQEVEKTGEVISVNKVDLISLVSNFF